MKAIRPIAASIAIQLCVGVGYIWSVFQTGVANSIFGGDNAAASLTFSLLLSTLTIGSVIGGKLAAKYTVRKIVIIGGIILSAGFLLASFVTPQTPWLIWLGYGVMGGVGMGFTYSTTIACAQKWMPHRRGFVTGLIVSALGFGGVVFTPVIEGLIQAFGGTQVGEPKTFLALSGVFLVVCTVGGMFLKDPPIDESSAASASSSQLTGLSPGQVLKNPRFYQLALSLMLACMAGLMMIGFAKPIAVAKGMAETATIGVLVISMCNSLGRLFWGTVSDKLGCKRTIMLLLIATVAFSLIVNNVNGVLIYVIFGLIAFCYGGFLSTFPSLTAELFGAKHMATNYGMVLLGFGVGAVASSYIAGHYKNVAAQDISLMTPAFFIGAACACLALVMMFFLRKEKKAAASGAAVQAE